MKILQVIHQFVPETIGGAELHCYLLSRRYMEIGHEMLIFTQSTRRAEAERLNYEGLEVLSLGKREAVPGIPFWRGFSAEAGFEKAIRTFRPDIVHFHHLAGLSLALPAIAKNENIPTVYTLHDYYLACPRGQLIKNDRTVCNKPDPRICSDCLEPTGLKKKLVPRFSAYRRFSRAAGAAVESIDAFIAPSRWMFDFFAKNLVPINRLYYIEHGLEDIDLLPVIPSSDVRFAYMGSIIPSKGIHILIKAFHLLGMENARLTLYGSFIPYHGSFDYREELTTLAGGDPRIVFHGPFSFDERADLYREIDVLVVPSIWPETYGLTVREGFQAGLEVIAADTGGLREAFADSSSNLFEPGSIESLTTAMEKAAARVSESKGRSRKRQPGKSMDLCASEVLEVYRKLVGGGDD